MEKILHEILHKLGNLENGQASLETKMTSVESKVTSLDSKVSSLESQVIDLNTKVTSLDSRVSNLETSVHEVRDIVTRIEVNQNEDVIALLKLFNTNVNQKTEALNKRLFQVESKLEATT